LTETRAVYLRIEPNGPLPDISQHAPFKAVVVLEAIYSSEWQDAVSKWLVDNGCLYMMAWGPDCSSWDNSVDHANMIEFPDFEIPDDKFVMTTWHNDEPLEDVFWYSQSCATLTYDDRELSSAIILHVSANDREAEILDLFERSKSLAEREPDGA
jgi:hypothetical protein